MLSFFFYLFFLLGFVVLAVYSERKIAAFIQSRLGPMEVGPYGLLQTIADLIKMLQKEDMKVSAIDRIPFLVAPLTVFVAVFLGYSVLPVNQQLMGASLNSGLFFLLAIISLDVFGILMAGWSSNNKYSLFGAIRSVAQIISYEVPLGLSVLCVVVIAGSLDLQEISTLQTGAGLFDWNLVHHPVLIIPFIIFFISSLAESNRTPFDLPESESELIGGYHTEYSGFRWGIFMLAEYGMMLLVSILGAILFLGSWNTPFVDWGILKLGTWTTNSVWGTIWLLLKSFLLVFLQMWVRWTFPRLRVDQLTAMSWKYLTPAILIMFFVCGIWKLWLLW